MTFYATEIDTCPAYGWQGGPNVDILIRQLRNRHERRNDRSGLALHTFTLPFQNIKDPVYLEEIKAAFLALGGPHHSFLTKDYGDYRHGFARDDYAPMPFGVGDGVTNLFQLSKTYTFGSAEFIRDITKPVAGHVVYVDGVNYGDVADSLTGLVDFGSNAPAPGAVLSWAGEFRVPVRFADFYLPSTIDNRFGSGQKAINGSCTLQEVPGE